MYTTRKKPKMQGKKPTHRNAIIHSQVLELIRGEHLKTTPQKGKLLKQRFDRLVTEAKKSTPASKRNVESFLRNDKAVTKLYKVILPRLENETSGYVISARTLPRKGDNAAQIICMVKGTVLEEKKSKLATVLEKQDTKAPKKRGGLKLGGAAAKVNVAGGGKKHDTTADTRRVST
jgi:ribosomal protein L17